MFATRPMLTRNQGAKRDLRCQRDRSVYSAMSRETRKSPTEKRSDVLSLDIDRGRAMTQRRQITIRREDFPFPRLSRADMQVSNHLNWFSCFVSREIESASHKRDETKSKSRAAASNY